MEFKRKPVRASESSPEVKRDSQSPSQAYEPYSRSSEPVKKSHGFQPNWITAAAAVPLVAVVIYFSIDPRTSSPIVERVENASMETDSVVRNEPVVQDLASPKLPKPSFVEADHPINHLDPRMTDTMADLRDEFNKSKSLDKDAVAKVALPAQNENTDWSVEGFDQESLDILAKNTKIWARMSDLDLDKQEIDRARHMVKTFKLSDAGEILPGTAGRATNNRTPSSTSEGKTCSLAPPRSPDPKCRANYPCRICGGCCCMCEAVLSGLAMNLKDR